MKLMAKNCQIIGILFYLNIVRKNVVCDEGLTVYQCDDLYLGLFVWYFEFQTDGHLISWDCK